MERVALDTSICIEIFRETPLSHNFLAGLSGGKPFLPTATFFELLLRTRGIEIVEAFAAKTELLPFDELSARKASEIVKELNLKGKKIDARDLFIAATAMANNCALATLNVKDFSKVKGLKIVKIM